jgi:hypothetical protein
LLLQHAVEHVDAGWLQAGLLFAQLQLVLVTCTPVLVVLQMLLCAQHAVVRVLHVLVPWLGNDPPAPENCCVTSPY